MREAAVVVVAAVGALGGGGAAELAAPDDQRVLQQAALAQVGEQAGDGLVGGSAVAGEGFLEVAGAGPSRDGRPR